MPQNLNWGFIVNLDLKNLRAALSTLYLFENGLVEFKNVLEFLALFSGDKKVVRLVLTRAQAQEVGRTLAQYSPNISQGSSRYVLHETFRSSKWDSFHERCFKAVEEYGDLRAHFFGEERFVALAIEAEDDVADAITLGALFGIPECCAKKYQSSLNMSGRWMQSYMQSKKPVSIVDATVNRFSSIVGYQMGFHNDYFPCSFDCEKTLKICAANRKRLMQYGFDELVDLINANTIGIAISYHDHVFYKTGAGFYNQFMTGQKLLTSGFTALTTGAPELPTLLTYSEPTIQTNTLASGRSHSGISMCWFALKGELE